MTRPLSILFALLLTFNPAAHSQTPPALPSHRMIDEIKAHTTGMAVWWTGHNGWLIKQDSILIGTDLVLENEDRQSPAPVSAAEIAPLLDISFITHEHGDHFGRNTSRILAEQSNCMFVMPANCVEIAKAETGIPAARIRAAIPRQPFTLRGVQITPMRAIHGNPKFAIFEEANLEDCGYFIALGDKTLLQPGDTVLLEDHLFLQHVDVLFFSPTEHNMHIQQSVILINELEPDYILPQHRDTMTETEQNRYWTHGYSREVRLMLSKTLKERYHILGMGEQIEIR